MTALRTVRRWLRRTARPVPFHERPGLPGGPNFPLWRAYAIPVDGRVRVQLDQVKYASWAAFTGNDCEFCALPKMRAVAYDGSGLREKAPEYCDVCDSRFSGVSGRDIADHDTWIPMRERDFGVDDTAASSAYLAELREAAERYNAAERARYGHAQRLDAIAAKINARKPAGSAAAQAAAGYWAEVRLPHWPSTGVVCLCRAGRGRGVEVVDQAELIYRSDRYPVDYASDIARVYTFERECERRNDEIARQAAAASGVQWRRDLDRGDAQQTALAINAGVC